MHRLSRRAAFLVAGVRLLVIVGTVCARQTTTDIART